MIGARCRCPAAAALAANLEAAVMRLRVLQNDPGCSPGPCPTVFEDLDDPTSLVIRGYLTNSEGVPPPPPGEGDFRVPLDLIVGAAAKLRAAEK
jgi:hypothetical protein